MSHGPQYMLAGAVRADVTLQDPAGLSPALIRATKAPAISNPLIGPPAPTNMRQSTPALGLSQLTPTHSPSQHCPPSTASSESNQVPVPLPQQGLISSLVHAKPAAYSNTALCSACVQPVYISGLISWTANQQTVHWLQNMSDRVVSDCNNAGELLTTTTKQHTFYLTSSSAKLHP